MLKLLFIYLISQNCDGLSQNKRKNLVMALLKNLQFGKHNVKRKNNASCRSDIHTSMLFI